MVLGFWGHWLRLLIAALWYDQGGLDISASGLGGAGIRDVGLTNGFLAIRVPHHSQMTPRSPSDDLQVNLRWPPNHSHMTSRPPADASRSSSDDLRRPPDLGDEMTPRCHLRMVWRSSGHHQSQMTHPPWNSHHPLLISDHLVAIRRRPPIILRMI